MAKHKIIQIISEERKLGICNLCGPVTIRWTYGTAKRIKHHYWGCSEQLRQKNMKERRSYRQHLKDHCERKDCEFVSSHPFYWMTRQLTIDHKNESGKDNRLENLWTLCASCHNLKSFLYTATSQINPIFHEQRLWFGNNLPLNERLIESDVIPWWTGKVLRKGELPIVSQSVSEIISELPYQVLNLEQ